ncbi:Hpt domain-containing protein [Tropicimonas marinistellae]|uniref:Hpt domain-containing protein n=1 Tax=Tropicimonas marinistellae TaxID=1739787 RepID=UPI00082C91AF|nr:Hpt domain-containing protein [Tropicimonas marinistellae]
MIDWKRVSELRSEIGAPEFDEVVELFLDEVECLLDRMRTTPKPELIEEDLHFLKGCAVNLGFSDFATLCLQGETMSAAGKPESVDLEQVFASYESSRTVFLAGVAAGLAA